MITLRCGSRDESLCVLPAPSFPGVELGATFLVVYGGRVFLFSAFRLNLIEYAHSHAF
jgi:hypothetical protein